MNLPGIYLITILILTFGVGASGQTFDEESNWYKEIGRRDDYYSRFDFTKYTKEDVEKAKTKYLKIASTVTSDEWAGSYAMGTMLGRAEIIWDRQHGFVYHYVYHTLANIDYGRVIAVGDSVGFVSQRPGAGKRKVEAGFFWEKVTDEDRSIGEVPTFPQQYSYLIRKPIRTQVLSVGKLRVKRETSADWGTTSEDHLRSLTLSSGQRHGIKAGMRFWVDDLEEWIEVISVKATRSAAQLFRPFIDGKEYCSRYENGNVTEFPCREPNIGMTARTKTEYF